MKIDKKTVNEIMKKYRETGSIEDRPGRGRKRKISKEDEKKMIKLAKKEKPATEIAQMYTSDTGKSIAVNTVRQLLHEHHFYFLPKVKIQALSEAHKQARLQYAIEQQNYNWSQVLFSDEKTFWLGSETSHCWQQLDKRVQHTVTRYPPKLHVWAAAGYYFKTKLYFFTQNMNQTLYQQIIKANLREKKITYAPDCPKKIRGKWVYLQDNDPKHTATKTMEILEELVGSRLIDHPSLSPDLNAMEDYWSYLDRKVRAAKVTSIPALKRKLAQEWAFMSWAEIRKSVDSMSDRLAECIERQGARTHY
jgi:transposase